MRKTLSYYIIEKAAPVIEKPHLKVPSPVLVATVEEVKSV